MAILDSRSTNDNLRKNVAEAVAKIFPIVEGSTEIRATNIRIDKPFDPAALQAHQDARLKAGTRAVPITADLELVKAGKVISHRTGAKIGDLPLLSGFGSFVIGGNDYLTHFAQLRLKPGIYTREATDGSFESTIHVSGSRITLWMEPDKGVIKIGVGTTNVNFLPIVRALGASDADIVREWGNDQRAREILARNETKKPENDITKLYEVVAKLKVKRDHLRAGIVQRDEEAVNVDMATKIETIRQWLAGKALDPYVTKKTTGVALTDASVPTLLAASRRIIEVQRDGASKADDRDAPEFKQALDVSDLIPERVGKLLRMWQYETRQKIKTKPDATLSQLIPTTFINDATLGYFLGSPGLPPGLSATAELPNPLAILANRDKMTITGPGGIQDAHSVTNEARLFRAGATGFVDPVQSPEGASVGVTTHAAMYTAKEGRTLKAPFYEVVGGKLSGDPVMISVEEANDSVVSLPESWDFKTKKPTGAQVRVIKNHQIFDAPVSQVNYVLPSGFSMFGATSNAASFLAHTHPNRGMMAGKHLTQTLPLVYREKPLATAKDDFGEDYNKQLGRLFSIVADESGTVTKIEPGAIWVGERKYEFFDRYPMQAKVTLHHEPRVKVGDKVKAGDIIADCNYTKDGVMAAGVNLRSAYTPWRNATNFEDAIVVSESAAKLLTSQHTHTLSLWPLTPDTIVDTKSYVAQFPTKLDIKKQAKLGPDGVVKEGQTVEMGDIIIAAMRENTVDAQNRTAENYSSIHKKLQRPYRDVSIAWDYAFPGKVYRVVKLKDRINVYVETEEQLQVGDKLSNGAAAKGTISEIIPDDRMPQDEKGRPIQIILNPHGVAGRINPGQTIEQAVGKLVRDGGKTYEYSHFDGRDHASEVKKALEDAGLKHEEYLFDPVTGRKTELPVATGYSYMVKLDHSVRKKYSARSRAGYTQDEMPGKGHGKSAQSFDGLTTAALLGHNAHAILGESYGIRGTKNDDFWEAFQAGEMPPPPKVPFAFGKFEAMLNAAGVNTSRNGKWMHFAPGTDKQTLERSNGEITDARMIRAKNLAEHTGGLFDVKKTGGMYGSDWTHIALAERIPHPLYEKAIRDVAEIKTADYLGLIAHTRHYDPRQNKFFDEPTENTLTGEKAFDHLLSFDVADRLKDVKRRARTAVGSDKNKLMRSARYLQGLQDTGLEPKDAYMASVIPVLPPKYRPIVEQQSGGLRVADANILYRDVMLTSHGVRDAKKAGLPGQEMAAARVAAYDAVAGLVGVGSPLTKRRDNQELSGFVQTIKGKSAKEGLFQQSVSRRRNDYSARTTIEPGGDLGPDEVSLPEDMAWELYKAVGIRRLAQSGINPADALQAWENRTPVARAAIDAEMQDRPVLINRSPSLHKLSVLAQWAKRHDGKAMRISPSVINPLSADFDGDTMSVVVPITDKAKQESIKLLPSNNLFYERDRSLPFSLEKDIITGLFMLTRTGAPTDKSYPSAGEAITTYEQNKDNLRMNSVVSVPGYTTKPTIGQLIFEDMVPARFRQGITYPLDGKKLEKILRSVAELAPSEYNRIVRAMSIAGFEYSARSGGITGTVGELVVDRSKITRLLDNLEGKIRGAGSSAAAKKVAVDTFLKETKPELKEIVGEHLEKVGLGGDIFFKAKPGAKLGFDSFMQMLASPTLVTDVKGEVIPSVIRSSYGSGMRPGDYLMTTPGARAGMVAKSLSTAQPGFLTKEIIANVGTTRISEEDCATHNGLVISLSDTKFRDPDSDILDRHLCDDIAGFKRNDIVTTRMLDELRKKKIESIKVRSPLTCASIRPPCRLCAPVHPDGRSFNIGDNIGHDFGQSVGERSTQGVLRAFHSGGTVGSGEGLSRGFARLTELLRTPEAIKEQGTLAEVDGDVQSIVPAPQGGWDVTIGGVKHYVRSGRNVTAKLHSHVSKGDPISDGAIRPQDIARLRGTLAVQNYMVDEMRHAFQTAGAVMRKPVLEVLVASVGRYVEVMDDAGAPGIVSGDVIHENEAEELKKKYPKLTWIATVPGVSQLPLHRSKDPLERLNFQRLEDTMRQLPAMSGKSDLTGEMSPIPGLAYGAMFRGDSAFTKNAEGSHP